MNDVAHALVDLDGTVYRGDAVVDGVPAALDRLRDHGVEVTFLTNNATTHTARYRERLGDAGALRDGDDVVTAGRVTARHVAERYGEGRVHVLGSDGLRDELRDAGLAPTVGTDADVAVVSMDPDFGLDDVHRAAQVARDGAFVATNRDPTLPSREEPRPGTGAIIAAVAAAVGRDPDVICGKPGEATVAHLADRLDDPERALLVGDRLATDVSTGAALGARTGLVLSGACDRDDVADAENRPDHVAATLPALVDDVLA